VTLARYAATQGFKVGFLDGAKAIQVRMYEGAAETWREWGRSLDLKDASTPAQVWGDLWLLLAVQGLPLPATCLLLTSQIWGNSLLPISAALGLNLFMLGIRFALLLAIAPSYATKEGKSGLGKLLTLPASFYLSPVADPLAVLRIFLSSVSVPRQWRGRNYLRKD
jgi:dolichol-phosphate mannosyltransferase